MLRETVVLTTLIALMSLGHAANVYKCQAPNGKYVYSDTPCPTNTETISRKKSAPDISGSVGRDEFVGKEPAAPSTTAPAPAATAPATADPNEAFLFRSRFAGALSALTPLKVATTEYFATHGRWPADVQALGLDPATLNSATVDRVSIKSEGAIVATLNRSFGQSKKIVLTPKPVMGGTHVEWQCATNFPRAQLGEDSHRLCESRNVY